MSMIFSEKESELTFYKEVVNTKKVLSFENPIFAIMLQGEKRISISSDSSVNLSPNNIAFSKEKIHTDISYLNATESNPNVCYTLEISRGRMDVALEKVGFCLKSEKDNININSLNDFYLFDKNCIQNINDELKKIIMLHQNNTIKFRKNLLDHSIDCLALYCIQNENWKTIINSQELESNPLFASINYINNNFTCDININDLAKKAYMSRSAYYKKFKQYFGRTPLDYILGKRIYLACDLLTNSQKSISTIAYEVGFNSNSYFTKCFMHKTSMLPITYRKANKNK